MQQVTIAQEDSLFLQFVQSALGLEDAITQDNLAEACESMMGKENIEAISKKLWVERQAAIENFFGKNSELSQESWSFVAADSSIIDTLSQVYYKVEYRVD